MGLPLSFIRSLFVFQANAQAPTEADSAEAADDMEGPMAQANAAAQQRPSQRTNKAAGRKAIRDPIYLYAALAVYPARGKACTA